MSVLACPPTVALAHHGSGDFSCGCGQGRTFDAVGLASAQDSVALLVDSGTRAECTFDESGVGWFGLHIVTTRFLCFWGHPSFEDMPRHWGVLVLGATASKVGTQAAGPRRA